MDTIILQNFSNVQMPFATENYRCEEGSLRKSPVKCLLGKFFARKGNFLVLHFTSYIYFFSPKSKLWVCP